MATTIRREKKIERRDIFMTFIREKKTTKHTLLKNASLYSQSVLKWLIN